MPPARTLKLPPHFYTTMQRTDFPFPHEDGDTLTSAFLRGYWWSGSIFSTYCLRGGWESWRESETVQEFVEFYMRCKCLLEHMEMEDAEFYAAIDRATTITQVLLYEVLQQKREEDSELCREWRDVLVGLKPVWAGSPYSEHKRFRTAKKRLEQLKVAFVPLLKLERTICIHTL